MRPQSSKRVQWTLYWRDGTKQVVFGQTISQAMTDAGYSAGAVGDLDFYAGERSTTYSWDAVQKQWKEVT